MIRKSGAATDEDFGKLFGVTKSSVSQWKNEKSPLPLEKFLSIFGPDTLDWIKGQYDLQDQSGDKYLAEFGRRVADAIHYGIETGIISLRSRIGNGNGSGNDLTMLPRHKIAGSEPNQKN
ncbi:MAG: hypothetical protein HGB04_06745 [Chlorobiaceae bacterium]|nr:hypothetical protein [Chlorobiaceae bacterium]